eukprot:TRINITY_DN8327_c0_g1_i2.p1 TRINITY_DN8327_c0_g1~~TRINITY_DN8327_c0_g1_i2.p1  ORF type:complete len:223 (-),score=65.83 TRINITY_DN8327_c0_g1_i2:191-859(-)
MCIRDREKEAEGDLYESDIGQGFHFRAGVYDGAISISAIQWLCTAAKRDYNPFKRLNSFFQSLYNCLRRGAKAVLQFYPDGPEQINMITTSALKAGFTGGLVVDYPHSSKAKKMYLVITAGEDENNLRIIDITGKMGSAYEDEEEEEKGQVDVLSKKSKGIKKMHFKKGKPDVKSREWILKKKQRQRKQGKEVRKDTKYTGRKRSSRRFLQRVFIDIFESAN